MVSARFLCGLALCLAAVNAAPTPQQPDQQQQPQQPPSSSQQPSQSIQQPSASSSQIQPKPSQQPSQQNPEIAIQDQDNFCLFLPPQPGLNVALYETQGKPFCMGSTSVEGAEDLPEGFVTVAHYQKNETYEQVTGYIDRSKYNLDVNDGGGQYDNHGQGKPTGASCKGYSYFVGMIEPSSNRFCMRCCQNKEDCPTGRSEYGCLRIIPGDYT
ncbi:hypothetical protein K492DRAFT_123483, partial [Lichtheimia hyalospora FSU 10163]